MRLSSSWPTAQKGLEVCYCSGGGQYPDPRLGPILGPSRSHPGSEVVPSRFAMCFVLQCFGPIQVPRWGPSRPVLVPSCSRAFLPGSGLDRQKQTSWPLPNSNRPARPSHCASRSRSPWLGNAPSLPPAETLPCERCKERSLHPLKTFPANIPEGTFLNDLQAPASDKESDTSRGRGKILGRRSL